MKRIKSIISYLLLFLVLMLLDFLILRLVAQTVNNVLFQALIIAAVNGIVVFVFVRIKNRT